MANPLRGEVEVSIEGKPYVLYLGINEVCALQDDLGLADKDDEFFRAFSVLKFLRHFKGARSAFYRALTKHQPDVTLDTAGDLFSALGYVPVVEALGLCVSWCMPKPDPKSETGGEARPSAGPTS